MLDDVKGYVVVACSEDLVGQGLQVCRCIATGFGLRERISSRLIVIVSLCRLFSFMSDGAPLGMITNHISDTPLFWAAGKMYRLPHVTFQEGCLVMVNP